MRKLFVCILLLPLLLSAFQTIPVKAQTNLESELVILSSHAKPILDSYKMAFEKYCRDVLGVSVTLTYSPMASEDAYKLAKEWAGRPRADIWWGGGVSLFQIGTADGLLLPYKCKDWAKVPVSFAGVPAKDPNGYWTGYAVSGFGLQVHSDYLKRYNLPEPKTWADLLNPAYSGHIVMCTPARSGSTHMVAEIILQGMGVNPGWAYLRKMAANVGVFTSRSADVKNDVDKGEHGIGLVVDYYGFDSMAAGLPVKLVYPTDYSFANPDSIAILAGAPHSEAAKAFVDYVISEEGQKLGMGIEQRGVKCPSPRLPVRSDVTVPASLPDISKVKMIAYNDTLANARYRDVNTIYENTIEKMHAQLKDGWKSIEAARKRLDDLKKDGYDVAEATTKVAGAETAFNTGDYAKAKSEADAAAALAKAPPPYTTYAAIIVVFVLLVLAVAMYKRRTAK